MNIDLEKFKKDISNIPKQEQRALVLYEVLGYKYKEIAQILKIEVSSVGVYIHRARTLVFSSKIEESWRSFIKSFYCSFAKFSYSKA